MKEPIHMQSDESINLFDYLVLLLKHKELIIKTTLAVMLVTAIVSFAIPPLYLAETKVLPPSSGSSSMASLMASQIAGLGITSSSLGIKTATDLYVSLLRTRGVLDYVIDNQKLQEYYRGKSRNSIRSLLLNNLNVYAEDGSGILIVGFKHRDPQKAAELANAFVEGLQNLNNHLAVTEASQRRLFFEEQLKGAKETLIASEDALKSFQQRTGTIKIDDEAKAVINTVAEMRAKISAKEVQLRVMRTYATPENPDILRLQDETQALKEELRKAESRTRMDGDPVPNVGRISSLSTEYLRRMRDFKYNESLYEILLKQYEAAKMDESRDATIIQVVEKAEPPDSKVSPKRKELISRMGVAAFLVMVLFVLLREFINNLQRKSAGEFIRLKETLDFNALIRDLKLDLLFGKLESIYRYAFKK